MSTNKNDSTQTFLQGLTPTDSIDYSLWKVTKKIKHITKSSLPLPGTMESRSDYPHTKVWKPSLRANILSPNKPPTLHIQSPRKASLKNTFPNGEKIN
jgi:hypothetical protein